MATLLLLFLLLQRIAAKAQPNVVHPHCQEFCGDYSIPYPFGIGPGCYRGASFEIKCKKMDDGTMLPFSTGILIRTRPVFNFSVSQSQATMFTQPAYECYNASGLVNSSMSVLDLDGTPFRISANQNKFTAIGCSTMAYIGVSGAYATGCMTFCFDIENLNKTTSSSCSGSGCCQTSLPENFLDYALAFIMQNDTPWNYPCSYSFLADQNWFSFDISYLKGNNFMLKFNDSVPLALDWVVEDYTTCDEAKNDSSSYACRSSNSECHTHNSSRRVYGYTYSKNCWILVSLEDILDSICNFRR